jgi:hypothetical protein
VNLRLPPDPLPHPAGRGRALTRRIRSTVEREQPRRANEAHAGWDHLKETVRVARIGDGGDLLTCSFCGKGHEQVEKLIAGPSGIYICDECVDLCKEIIEEERGAGNSSRH